MKLPDRIHFIKACDKAMSATILSVAKLGVNVTGYKKENVSEKIICTFKKYYTTFFNNVCL